MLLSVGLFIFEEVLRWIWCCWSDRWKNTMVSLVTYVISVVERSGQLGGEGGDE